MFSGLSPAQPAARRWTALASFTLQAAIVAVALVFPMLYPQNLPPIFLTRRIFVPPSNGVVRADASRVAATSSGAVQPHRIVVSSDPHQNSVFDPARQGDGQPPGIETLTGNGEPNSILTGLVTGPANPIPPPVRPPKPPKVSVVMEGNLIHRVEPQYPAIARQIRLEGSVILKAIISPEGSIERIDVASGQTLLARAAKDAVQQWKYRPYLLNGEPIEVETEITVNFVLQH